jgi:hypothetical protein
MTFRECVNCCWLSCTIQKTCFEKKLAQVPEATTLALQIEAENAVKMKRKPAKKPRKAKCTFAPNPYVGFTRRQKANGKWSNKYNFIHKSSWHHIYQWLKNH